DTRPETARNSGQEVRPPLAAPLTGMPTAAVEAIDDMLIGKMVSQAVGRPGTGAANVTAQAALEMLGTKPGPDRILDLLLRAGTYGDGFDARREGLSLARLRAAEHGVDLGALEPRLPGLLATP